MAELVCLGEPLVEFNQQEDGRFLRGFGGDVSNVAISAARQGAKTAMLSRVGQDQFGDDLRQLWRDEGVGDEYVLRSAGGETGIYFVTHDKGGHNFTYRRKNSAASEYKAQDLPLKAIANSKIFYTSGISLAVSENMQNAVIAAAKVTQKNGCICAFDPNLRTKLWPLDQAQRTIHAFMANCDIALPSLDDARYLTGMDQPEQITAFYHDLGASEVIVTLGSDGVLASDGSLQRRIDSIQVKAIDATGAGDCFNGAYLASRLRGLSVFQAAEWATVCAALSTRGLGAVAPVPTLKEAQKYIEQTGEHDAG